LKVLVALACLCSSMAAAEPRVLDGVESQVVLRRWNASGGGEPIGSELLSVVLSESGAGDVVVLTWSTDRRSFTAEVFRPLPPVNGLREWESVGASAAKKLSEQPGGTYAIQYTRAGPDGGLIVQTFRLPGQK
jgi:hypothetical protein